MNLKKIALLLFCVVLIYACEKPIFSKKEYKVSGILYGSDEKTPLVNKKLLLWGNRYNQNQALNGQYSESIAETETDSEGYFELIYPKNRKADYVKVVDEGGEEFSGVIGINENYYQDLCVVDVAYLSIKVNLISNLGIEDTIYIQTGGEPVTINSKIGWRNDYINLIPYPFIELDALKKIPHYDLEYNNSTYVKWGIGKKDFQVNAFDNISETGYPIYDLRVNLSGFPYTDTVEIEIKK